MNKKEAENFLKELVIKIKKSDQKERFDSKPILFFIKDERRVPSGEVDDEFTRYYLDSDPEIHFDSYEEMNDSEYKNEDFEEFPMRKEEFFYNLAFLTRESCQDHIDKNYYHYNKPRTYSRGVYRDPLMEGLFESLTVLFGKGN